VNIYHYLKQDHARLRSLANRILDAPPESPLRYKLFMKFKAAIRSHADIEARTLYTTLLRIPRAHPVAREGIEGQRRMAEALGELEHYPLKSDKWTLQFSRIRELLEEQQCEEEELLYPAAQRLLTQADVVGQMTDQYRESLTRHRQPDTEVTNLCAGKHRPFPPVDSRIEESLPGTA